MLTIDGVDMVDVREAARLARRTSETIRRWVWSGRLDARRDGNRLLVARNDVLRLVGRDSEATPAGASLSQWADEAALLRRGRSGGSASTLVIEDRRSRGTSAGR